MEESLSSGTFWFYEAKTGRDDRLLAGVKFQGGGGVDCCSMISRAEEFIGQIEIARVFAFDISNRGGTVRLKFRQDSCSPCSEGSSEFGIQA